MTIKEQFNPSDAEMLRVPELEQTLYHALPTPPAAQY